MNELIGVIDYGPATRSALPKGSTLVDPEDHRRVIFELLKEAKRLSSAGEDIPDSVYVFAFAWLGDRRVSPVVKLDSPRFRDENGALNLPDVCDPIGQVLDTKSAIHADLTNRIGAPPEIVAFFRRDKVFSLDPNRNSAEQSGGSPAIDAFFLTTQSTDAQLVVIAPIVNDRLELECLEMYFVKENGFERLGAR